MSFADATIKRLPGPIRPYAEQHHELIKFAIVGATTFVIDFTIFFTLKLTILEPKPVTAKIIAGIVAVIASYILNREWSFRDRGGRERHHEALLFFGVSGVGVLLSMAPLWVSSYVLMLRVPMVSLATENIADFISAYIVGNLLQMAFRFWAFRRFVFPDEFARNPDKALESTLTGGGFAEALEDGYEARHQHDADPGLGSRAGHGNVTPMRRSRRRAQRQPGDSSDPRVSKTS
ncbi:MAG: GtrA family protein [Mycobacterium sp.]